MSICHRCDGIPKGKDLCGQCRDGLVKYLLRNVSLMTPEESQAYKEGINKLFKKRSDTNEDNSS